MCLPGLGAVSRCGIGDVQTVRLRVSCVLLLCEEDAGRKAVVHDWDMIVERKMDSDSLGDAGVMVLVLRCLYVCAFAINAAGRRGGD